MNRYTRIVIILTLIALLCPELVISQADSGSMTGEEFLKRFGLTRHRSTWLPLDVFMEPSPLPTEPGEVNIRLMVVAYKACDEVKFKISKIQNLELLDPDISSFSIGPHDTVTYDLSVVVPANDTSGLEIDVFCDRVFHKGMIWFETWSDSISWSVSPPWGPYGHPDTWQRRTTPRPERTPQEPEPYKGPTTRRGFEDRDGNFILRDSLKPGMILGFYDLDSNWVRVPNPADSISYRPGYQQGLPFDSTMTWNQDDTGYWHYVRKDSVRRMWERNRKPDEPVNRMELMHELEKTPLEGFSSQRFVIGDRLFERQEGEYKFKEVTDMPPKNYRQWRDSVALASDKTFDVTLDLRDAKHYELAAQEIDSLILTDSAGFYRAIVTFAVVSRLREQGVNIRRTPDRSRRKRDSVGAIESPSEDAIELSADFWLSPDGVETLLAEDFDSVFPGSRWEAWDENPDMDSAYWGTDTCFYMSDPNSVWCAGAGNGWYGACPNQWYDTDMEAHMELASPLDISRHTGIELRHNVRYELWEDTSEWGEFDICIVRYSQNNSDWTDIDYYVGSLGWRYKSYLIDTDTLHPLYLQYVFYAEFYSEVDNEDGVFIDNVSVHGERVPWPELTYGTPAGWSGPIVPSHQQNTNVVDVLYTGQTTYFDFAVQNTGEVACGQFWVQVLIDGEEVDDIQFSGIFPSDFGTEEDWVFTISTAGQHTIAMHIDVDGDVSEDNENNNYYEQTFTWEEPPVYEPNLTYTIPYNWDAPIVASNHEGGHRNTTLFANTSTYIDWNVKNTGNAVSASFSTYLLIDGEFQHGQGVPGLGIGERFDIDDIWCNLIDSGDHTLRIVIDTLGQVLESNELDNDFDTAYHWYGNYVTMNGTVYYWQPRGQDVLPYWYNLVGYRAELWDADPGQPGEMLDSMTTIAGYEDNFSFAPVYNVEEDGTKQDLFVRFIADNAVARAGSATLQNHPFSVIPGSFDTDTIVDCVDGTHTWGDIFGHYGLPDVEIMAPQSGYFYVADILRDAHEYWDNVMPLPYPPLGFSQALLSNLPTGYGYIEDTVDHIYIDTTHTFPAPDVFDEHQIINEFAHRLQFLVGFLDDSSVTSHSWTWNPVDPNTALHEGFSYWWAGMMTGDDTLYRSGTDFADTTYVNLEDGGYGQLGTNPGIDGTTNAHGLDCEGSVAGILWDIVDLEPDDYSSRDDWNNPRHWEHNDDGIWDSLYTGPGPERVLLALLDSTRLVAGHHPKNMDEFWTAWFSGAPLGYCRELFNIYWEHGDSIQVPGSACTCCRLRGDFSRDEEPAVDISDLVMLVDYMFTGGPAPVCWAEANVDGSGPAVPPDEGPADIDISDLVTLVDYMFTGGDAPPSC